MDWAKRILANELVKRLITLVVIALALYGLRSMLDLLLLTFVMTYLFYSMQSAMFENIRLLMPVKRKTIVVLMYAVLFTLIVWLFCRYLPMVRRQLWLIYYQVLDFNIASLRGLVNDNILALLRGINIDRYLQQGSNHLVQLVTHVGRWSLNMLLAFVLSVFFLIEKEEIVNFMSAFKDSRMAYFYDSLAYLGHSFLNSFGKVINAQITISCINTVLSVLVLVILGFPQVLGLGFMIFFLGLVPVAGVFISLMPLSILAFKLGGITKVISVLIMIVLLHGLESYILNPKLMSAQMKLPVFFTFLILIVSEHLLGIWGLLVGLPLFSFVLDMLDVKS